MKMILILVSIISAAVTAAAEIHTFDNDKEGDQPGGFFQALTGKGRAGVWLVQKDESAPSKPNILIQNDTDTTNNRFPLCVLDKPTAADVDLSVSFKTITGVKDQAAGLVWRYQDNDNYYIVRANALEDNVVLYKVENGKRADLKPQGADEKAYGKEAKVESGQWHTLRVLAKGPLFEVFFNRKKQFEVKDATFSAPGKVGLWTKADSVTQFDDLKVEVLR